MSIRNLNYSETFVWNNSPWRILIYLSLRLCRACTPELLSVFFKLLPDLFFAFFPKFGSNFSFEQIWVYIRCTSIPNRNTWHQQVVRANRTKICQDFFSRNNSFNSVYFLKRVANIRHWVLAKWRKVAWFENPI